MFKNYLKVAFRNIVKHKGYSFINIFGLAVGMAVCIIILLWVQYELSYDRFHENADDLYRVIKVWRKGEVAHQALTPAPLAPALKEEFPEIIEAARFYGASRWLLAYGEKAFYEQGGVFTDPAAFNMFTFPLVKGNPKTVLSRPRSMVLTEAMAAKYFGDQDPMGKTLRVDNQYDFSVTGVVKNFPRHSHIRFDFAVPFSLLGKKGLMEKLAQENLVDWHNTAFYSYVLLKKGTSYKAVNEKIANYLEKPIPDSTSSLYLQPLKEIHLFSSYLRGNVPGSGDIGYIYLFSAMALIILLIACINFMNLATARAGHRAKEVGMRKVVGAPRTGIIKQFLGESIISAFMALILAVILLELSLPVFNRLSGKQLTLSQGLPDNLFLLMILIGITLFTGTAAGSYPALFLSAFQPAKVLKDKITAGTKGGLLRKILVIFQFSLTIIFLVGSLVIYEQIDYLQNKKMGFEKNHLLYMEIPDALKNNYETLKNELRQNDSITGVTASVSLPSFGRDINTQDVSWEGKESNEEILMRGVGVDYDFIETFKMKMLDGRPFSRAFSNDGANYILNETAVKAMGIQAPVGKQFTLWDNTGTIIGVVKDYHFRSLRTGVAPLLLRVYDPQWLNYVFVRIKPGHIPGALDFLESKWKQLAPGYPFEYRFVDDLLDSLYTTEQRIKSIFTYLTLLAMCISCLGLFGLAAFLAEQRTKEVGVRKVFGASAVKIGLLFSGEFLKWILAACVIAWPLAYIFLDHLLLRNYVYRITIGIRPFLLSGILAMVIALLTIGHRVFKTAAANPIEALRYE